MGVNRLNPVQKATYFEKNQKWEKWASTWISRLPLKNERRMTVAARNNDIDDFIKIPPSCDCTSAPFKICVSWPCHHRRFQYHSE